MRVLSQDGAPAVEGEKSMAIVASAADSVASRVEALYDKIRDPAPSRDGPSRESGARVQTNTMSNVELIENQVLSFARITTSPLLYC